MKQQAWIWVATGRWVRVFVNGEKIADSKRVMLMREDNHMPTYYFPLQDVRQEVLVESEYGERANELGTKRFWHVHIKGDRRENAASTYEAKESCPDLTGYIAFDWHKMDKIMEEEEQVYHHPRDPYHRVDTLPTSRHIEVYVDEVKVADTTRPFLLFETSMSVRYYIPTEDVNHEHLQASHLQTHCPYKGFASYYHLVVNGERLDNAVWFYPNPLPETPKIKGTISFWPEKSKRIRVVVDGEGV